MEDLLDGRAANAERLAAIGKIDRRLNTLVVPDGVVLAGSKTRTFCQEGQNNFKVHEGYRIFCNVSGRAVFGWSGSFETGSDALVGSIGTECATQVAATEETPAGRSEVGGGVYLCADQLQVRLVLAQGKDVATGYIDSSCTDSNIRCVSGKSPEEIERALVGADWYAVQISTIEYYREEV